MYVSRIKIQLKRHDRQAKVALFRFYSLPAVANNYLYGLTYHNNIIQLCDSLKNYF